MVTQSSQASSETSFYLAYIVALHCATALALLWFFRADWVRITRGLLASLLRGLRERRLSIQGPDERLAWMIVIATIPVGLTGIAFEHTFRTIFANPPPRRRSCSSTASSCSPGNGSAAPTPRPAGPPRPPPPGRPGPEPTPGRRAAGS